MFEVNAISPRKKRSAASTHDFDFVKGGHLQAYVVINNLFNIDPPIAPGAASASDGAFYDLIGRDFFVGARLKF